MSGACPGCGGRPQVFLYRVGETLGTSINEVEVEVSCPRCRIGVKYRGLDIELARRGALRLWAELPRGA